MSQRDISFQDGGATDHFLKYQFIYEFKNNKKSKILNLVNEGKHSLLTLLSKNLHFRTFTNSQYASSL